jgi:tetratricopeptide (TPR) repeat protein
MVSRLNIFVSLLVFIFLAPTHGFAQSSEERLALALRAFNRGNFSETLRELERIQTTNQRILSTRAYLRGVSHSRLQQFTRASEALNEAANLGNDSRDLFYELGQAYYARNSMEDARKSFLRSYQLGHMRAVSLYYMAHISQLLYEHDKAMRFFEEILNESSADANLKQVAIFQRAEVQLVANEERTLKERSSLVSTTIIPELDRALEAAPEGNAVADIRRRRQEILDQYNLDPTKMLNGRPIPQKKFSGNFSQKLRYDDNITLANDQPTVVATQRDSYVLDSSLYATYNMALWRRLALMPELRISRTHHLDRQDSTIYSNDRLSYAPAIRSRIEHKIFDRQAAFIMQLFYDKAKQASTTDKSLEDFSESWTYGTGYRISLLPWGDSTVRFRHKRYRAENNSLDNDTNTFSLEQSLMLPNRHLIVLLLQYDDTDNFNNPNSSSTTTMARADYIITNIIPRTNLYFGLSYMGMKTELQPERGNEVTWNPSVRMTRRLSPNMRLGIDYNYNTKSSGLVANEYTKNTTSLELRYDF